MPYLGICLGMQVATIEYARHVAGLAGANSTEFDPDHAAPGDRADRRMAGPRRHDPEARRQLRPGRHDAPGRAELRRASPARWRTRSTAPVVTERHRHRYEANEHYLDRLQQAGLVISAHHAAREADRDRRAAARACTPGSWACSSTPSSSRTPWDGHPLFISFIKAALEHQAGAHEASLKGGRMKLCGFEVGLRPALLPDRRPLRGRERSSCRWTWPGG